jgi:hypothetical protein
MMKNNTLAMVATIALALSIASLIGYVEPTACTVVPPEGFPTCEETASQRLWTAGGLFLFGAATLVVGTLRSKRRTEKVSGVEVN